MALMTCDICGGMLVMDGSGEFSFCEFCGVKYTKDRMQAKIKEIRTVDALDSSVKVEGIATIDKMLQNGETFLKLKKYEDAENIIRKACQEYPEDYRGWMGLAVLCTESFDSDLLLHYQDNLNCAALQASGKVNVEEEFHNKWIHNEHLNNIRNNKERFTECFHSTYTVNSWKQLLSSIPKELADFFETGMKDFEKFSINMTTCAERQSMSTTIIRDTKENDLAAVLECCVHARRNKETHRYMRFGKEIIHGVLETGKNPGITFTSIMISCEPTGSVIADTLLQWRTDNNRCPKCGAFLNFNLNKARCSCGVTVKRV